MKSKKSKSIRRVLSAMLIFAMMFSVMMPASYADETGSAETNIQEQTESLDKIVDNEQTATDSAIETESSESDGKEQTDSAAATADDNEISSNDKETTTDSAIKPAATETQIKLLETTAEETEPSTETAVYWTDNLTEKPDGFTVGDEGNVSISSAEGLAWLAVLVLGLNGQEIDDFEGKNVTLTEDVDLSGKLWTPIGRYEIKTIAPPFPPVYQDNSTPFKGNFDGNNRTISGLKLADLPTEYTYYGLFSLVRDGSIKNLYLKDVDLEIEKKSGTNRYAAALVGAMESSIVESCNVRGNLKAPKISGIANILDKESNILKCSFKGNLSADHSAYGITDQCGDTIDQCYVSATISGETSYGICGLVSKGTVSNCYTEGSLDSTENNIGGICGELKSEGTIENCYSTMTVKGKNHVGGIAGTVASGTNIRGCVALNDTVTAEDGTYVGRIVADKSTFVTGELKKNFAYTGMKVYSKDDDGEDTLYLMGLLDTECMASDKQGEDIAANDLAEDWPVKDWDESVWNFEKGKLPTLKNLSDKITQIGNIPNYISADSEKDWELTAFDKVILETPEVTIGTQANYVADLLPKKLFATKDGTTAVSIPDVTWKSDEYNGNKVGEYTFTAVLPLGYKANTDLPTIKVNVVLKYTVNFDTNGADEIEDLAADNNSTINKPSDPIREGFNFEGWYKDEECSVPWDFENDKVTSTITLYAKWSIVGTPDYIASESGNQTSEVSEMGFTNASVVKISSAVGYTTYAVVVSQKINFYIPKGEYVITDSGETVSSLADKGYKIDQLTGFGQTPQELRYKGSNRGTEEEPLTIMSRFFTEDALNLAEEPKSVSLTFRLLSLIAGYDTEGVTNNHTPYYMVVEDRNESTGKLEASFTIDGSRLKPCYHAGWFRSPRTYGILLNPSDTLIKGYLDTPSDILNTTYHTLYVSDTYPERYEAALETLKAVRDDGNKVLMMHTQTRDFPGPVTFKLDVSKYFNNGDTVNVNYLLGAGNVNLYHGLSPKPTDEYMMALESTYIKNNTSAEVKDGYITFDLKNGGYFELVKAENDTPRTKYAVEFITNSDKDGEIYPSTIYPQILDSETGYIVTKPDDPTEEGNTFDGWYTDEERTEAFDFDTPITDDVILYAKWSNGGGSSEDDPSGGGSDKPIEGTYTVEFITGKTESGYDSAKIPSQTVKEGERATDPAEDTNICPFGFYDRGDGYLVLDWYTDEDLKNKFRFSDPITKSTKLYPEYQRYILKDDGKTDGGSGSESNPYKVKLGDTKQSKIAWKFFNKLASGAFKGYYKVYVEKNNDGDELFSWTFNSNDFNSCDVAQPYYIYIDTEKDGDTIELEFVNRTAIEGKVKISVDISSYIEKGEVEIEYKSGSCDGKVVHSNVESGDWVQSHHKPKSYFTNTTATVEDGYLTFDITHGGTYIIKSDQLKDDENSTASNDSKTLKKEIIKAGEKIDTDKIKKILDEGKALLIESDNGTVLFDTKALKVLKEKNKGDIEINIDLVKSENLSEKQKKLVGDKVSDRPIYSLTVKTGNENITNFGEGEVTVTLPYELKDKEQTLGVVIWYINDSGEIVDMPCDYDIKNKEATFTTNHFSYYAVGYDKSLEWNNPFTDVKETDWFFKAVANINRKGLMSGVSKTQFKPNDNTTRAMLVTILYRMENSPDIDNNAAFKDISNSSWYADSVSWAVKNNIVNGYSQRTFAPNDPITREQLVSVLYRYKKMKNADMSANGNTKDFKDASLISSWASDSIKWALGAEVLTGKGNGNLDPKGNATRAEVAALIERI
ncbi:S-layer homology domain-containing protein [Anaerovorax odorimutans]|uniref:S-layer homology domain-containing protein n=1 Tax=Anaerovorax odorimutans TaxID=109327 RepID=UPI00146B7A41|nr:S-layer homology domain-containing protein [Anaerovorax odorimutans]